jgi:hypothetical protein
MRGISQLRHKSIEHGKREVVKIEAEKTAKQSRRAKKNYVDCLALPVGFTRLECLLALKYLIIIKSLTDSKIQKTGWSITWKQ